LTPLGRKSGSITLAMKSTVMSGTPRQSSTKAIDAQRMIGSLERRPRASNTPSGREATMPVTATTRVTMRPPQLEVSTGARPKSSSSAK
jgi:hypothetical protein